MKSLDSFVALVNRRFGLFVGLGIALNILLLTAIVAAAWWAQ